MLSFTELALTMGEADAYAASRGLSAWAAAASSPDEAREAALRRGQDYVAGTYNGRWLTEWENDDAPDEVKYAVSEAAILELATPGTLAPVLERGGAIKREMSKVDVIETETEYMDSAPARATITKIDLLLTGLILSGNVSFLLRA